MNNLSLSLSFSLLSSHLLRPPVSPGLSPVIDRKGHLKVSKDTRGRVVVGGVTQMFATTAEDMANILSAGQAKRHVSSTKMNSESSRSHLVSSIIIEATDKKTKLTTTGKLTLVDLAGSESQKKTGATGNQLKEAKGTLRFFKIFVFSLSTIYHQIIDNSSILHIFNYLMVHSFFYFFLTNTQLLIHHYLH